MTAPTFSTLGALVGLVLAIILIVKKSSSSLQFNLRRSDWGNYRRRRSCRNGKSHGQRGSKHDVSCPSYHDEWDFSRSIN